MASGDRSPIEIAQVTDAETSLSPLPSYLDAEGAAVEVAAEPSPGSVADALDPGVDCVVTEYELAETDGLAVLESVRSASDQVPVALFTEADRPPVVEEVVTTPATTHLRADALQRTPTKVQNRLTSVVDRYRQQRLDRHRGQVTDLVYRINQGLGEAESRTEIQELVCTEISETPPYPFAWIGTIECGSAEVLPQASAGIADDYLDAITIRADDSDHGRGPAGRAIETGSVAVSDDIASDPAFEPWREQAIDRGFASAAAVPLTYADADFGILALYADRPYAFGEQERSLLEQLGTDISRALHETGLQAELWEFQQMAEQADNAIFLTDETGTLRYANPAFERLVETDGDSLVGATLRDLDVDTAPESSVRDLLASVEDGRAWSDELRVATADGEERTIDLTLTPLASEAGERIVGVGTDMTEQRAYWDRLEHQRERLTLLNHIVRHDIRNDVMVLRAGAELLREHVDEAGAEHLDRIERKVEAVIDLTQSARELVEAITDEADDETTAIDVGDVVDEEIDAFATSYDADVSGRGSDRALPVEGDRMLHSVFRNLLQNTAQHSDRTTVSVDVTAEAGTETTKIRIADDGPGIDDDRKDQLFEYGKTSEPSSGSGIGLFLVDTLVDAYGGEIHVEDNEPDGTVFVVELQQLPGDGPSSSTRD